MPWGVLSIFNRYPRAIEVRMCGSRAAMTSNNSTIMIIFRQGTSVLYARGLNLTASTSFGYDWSISNWLASVCLTPKLRQPPYWLNKSFVTFFSKKTLAAILFFAQFAFFKEAPMAGLYIPVLVLQLGISYMLYKVERRSGLSEALVFIPVL